MYSITHVPHITSHSDQCLPFLHSPSCLSESRHRYTQRSHSRSVHAESQCRRDSSGRKSKSQGLCMMVVELTRSSPASPMSRRSDIFSNVLPCSTLRRSYMSTVPVLRLCLCDVANDHLSIPHATPCNNARRSRICSPTT